MRPLIIAMLIGSLLLVMGDSRAQDETAEGEFTSTVFYFWAACENQAVIDLDGTMETGYDVYVQVFRELGATGQALTGLTRVPVSGDYQVSQTLNYTGGETLNLGQFASVRVSIARENNPDDQLFTEVLDDTLNGCIEPTYGSVDTFDASGSGSGTPLIDPVTGEVITDTSGLQPQSSGIFTPDGGVLNEVVARPSEAVVQIGARPSANEAEANRVSDPGLIFAECDAFEGADPGVVWDIDNVTVFWSWFAETPELVREHIATAQYEVFLSSPYAARQPFPNVDISPVVQREDGNYWTFYTADLGNGFRPGQYVVDYYVTWPRAISDGFESFGPGTETPSITGRCVFDIEPNPFGTQVELKNPTIPLQQGQ